MSFETISLLLNWVQLGVLLAMLFRLRRTFELIANTQRELRRAIHHLGERRSAELDMNNALGGPETVLASRSRWATADPESTMDADDLASLSP
jgi:C4-dicarboxylate-specific signal transduction histidine kinase